MPQSTQNDAIANMRYGDEFWHITKTPFWDRFWTWWQQRMLEPWRQDGSRSVVEGNILCCTQFNRFIYEVRSKEIDVPLMLIESAFDEPPLCYVLAKMPVKNYHLALHQSWIEIARTNPTIMPYERVSYSKMRQLAMAGSTPNWVHNKMLGMYDGEEN